MTSPPPPCETPFVMIPARVLANESLSSPAKLVYSVILDHANDDGVSRVGARRIATRTGVAKTTVLRAIDHLEEAGEITIERGESGRRHVYRVTPTSTEKRSRNATGSNTPNRSRRGPERSRNATGSGRGEDHVHTYSSTDVCAAPSGSSGKPKNTRPTNAVGAVLGAYAERWSARYSGKYKSEDRGRDAGLAKRILADCDGSVDEVVARLDHFFAAEDGWLAENRHPLPMFAKQHGRHATPRETAVDAEQVRPPAEPLIVADARRKWPDDFEAHERDYRLIAAAADAGRIPLHAVARFAGVGPAFRANHAEEVRRVG